MEKVAGVDIGGTKLRWIVFDGVAVLSAREVPTPQIPSEFAEVLREIGRNISAKGVTRIGIGTCGRVAGTTLVRSSNLPAILNLDLRDVLQDLPVTIAVDNDARCFARAEAAWLARRGIDVSRVLVITLGTGVGRAIIDQDQVVREQRFEVREAWESEYRQRVADSAADLASWLTSHIGVLIAELRPGTVVFGGGRLRTPGLFSSLRDKFRLAGITIPVVRSHWRQNAGAIGAALLCNEQTE